jgi:hypothetical protein
MAGFDPKGDEEIHPSHHCLRGRLLVYAAFPPGASIRSSSAVMLTGALAA